MPGLTGQNQAMEYLGHCWGGKKFKYEVTAVIYSQSQTPMFGKFSKPDVGSDQDGVNNDVQSEHGEATQACKLLQVTNKPSMTLAGLSGDGYGQWVAIDVTEMANQVWPGLWRGFVGDSIGIIGVSLEIWTCLKIRTMR